MAAQAADGLQQLNLTGSTSSKKATPQTSLTGSADKSDPQGSDDDEDEEEPQVAASTNGVAKKKKKKKPKKKKSAAAKVQSDPPRVPVANLFPNGQYPVGEEVEYQNENAYRTTSEEKRHLDRMNADFLTDYRHGAEVHRQVRQWAQTWIKPGQTLHEIAEGIEDSVRALTGHPGLEEGDGMKGGIGFPTGLSINHCAAHYTPNTTSKPWVLGEKDVLKVDFGVHFNGRIVDSAFTLAFDPQFDPLLAAVRD